MTNVVKAIFGESRKVRTRPLYQYDYGQVLAFVGLTLPETYEVQFSNDPTGASKTMIGGADGVDIPDEYLTTGKEVYAWLYLHAGASDGYTAYTAVIPVTPRASITNEEPTPVQQDAITTAIAELQAGVAATEAAVAGVGDAIDAALEEAKESGEFDGPQGEPGAGIIPGGDVGQVLAKKTGADYDTEWVDMEGGGSAVSPTANVVKVGNAATITITDKSGTTTATVYDGADGAPGRDGDDGQPGQDGHTPVITASKSGDVTTIYSDGVQIAQVNDGQQGQPGQDGSDGSDGTTFTPAVSGAGVISWTNDGGKQNPPSIDLVAAVINALPSAVGVSF